jgi:hypothetical protein
MHEIWEVRNPEQPPRSLCLYSGEYRSVQERIQVPECEQQRQLTTH